MIYLDYSATTPVLHEVLDSYTKTTKSYIGNANSLHRLGSKSKDLLESATKQICDLFDIKESEIIYTSGATQSNNMALLGVMLNHKPGSELIISKLEHPSIYAIATYLQEVGYKVIEVNNTQEGIIDFDDLKSKINENTILVSINGVNSEIGVRQPLKTIKQIIKKQNPKVLLHSDLTQGLGKINVNLKDVDLASGSSHKIFGPKGIGFLYKDKSIKLKPILFGSTKQNYLLPGTPPLPLIVALSKAIRIALDDLNRKETYVKKLNDKICNAFIQNRNIIINKTKYCIPHILNISIPGIKPETIIHALEEEEIYVGTNTACATGEESSTLMAIYNDKKRSLYSIRISLSYMTTNEDVNNFIKSFNTIINKLKDLTIK